MTHFNFIRGKIKEIIINRLVSNPEVCSITFVGSFVNTDKFSSISDIDVIVIVNKLNSKVFFEIESSANTITGAECGLPDYQVKLNMSFGPLKFNNDKTVVFHLMVYDRDGHRNHVISSPFTCYDWEYYPASYGESLSDIYPAAPLQLRDLIGSRRSLESYLDDLLKGVITFRYYSFTNEIISEVKETYPMDDRHKKEYAYHVMKFLMLNLLKIVHQYNKRFNDKELAEEFYLLNSDFNNHVEFFLDLSNWKNNNQVEPKDIFERLEIFIKYLNFWFSNLEANLPKVSFIRHGKTELNDGSFLGIGRNPSLLPTTEDIVPTDSFDLGYSGMMNRTVETLQHLDCKIQKQSILLNEINYGLAEGLSFSEFASKYPNIKEAWERKEDPRFPKGENQRDVAARLLLFINQELFPARFKHTAVVTHMVVLRCLLAQFYNAEIQKWFHFQPGHLEQISFRIYNGTFIPELTELQRIKFRDQLMLWETK